MSEVKHTRCDAPGCGLVCPEEPGSRELLQLGWCRVSTASGERDLCPGCTERALVALGIRGGAR